jgi:hypothetical protein
MSNPKSTAFTARSPCGPNWSYFRMVVPLEGLQQAIAR